MPFDPLHRYQPDGIVAIEPDHMEIRPDGTAAAKDSAYTDLMLVPSLDMIVALFLWMTTLVPPAADAMVTVHGPPEPSVVVLLTIHCPPATKPPLTMGRVYVTFADIAPETDSDRDRYCATVKVAEPEVAFRLVTPPNA